ncbi:hypothetical protein GPECTOR_92g585 [Gonium pectorale]|uniref:Uncharacterized protein n=1 Tax=Gonium pectorale TaxID=33097 RepID=A0A150G0I5_GONPE|nr:hypothetical protein GPECTOR_92g585 [Gonium pectorale]|eukprot:KXZ43362.1 hypothetical protein GPECTOR_92g585 [Gonium pectorale]
MACRFNRRLPPRPPPPAATYWATSASAASDLNGSSTADGSASKLVGNPYNKTTLTALKKCKPVAGLSWVPTIKLPRWVAASFNQTPAATGATVSEVLVWINNKGEFDPAFSTISLVVRQPNATTTTTVPIYEGDGKEIKCPGLNRFQVNTTIVARSMALRTFRSATVLSVRIDVTSVATNNKKNLPHVAAIGLQLSE